MPDPVAAPRIRKKLIEVSIPLEAINKASAREKSIRHGHPSTLHLWWARRPLAACRAVLFAQLVDDPSAWPDRFPTEAAQESERKRLHKVIADLVPWEASNNEDILNAARWEIARSVAWRLGEEPPAQGDGPAILHYLQTKAPPVYDPFSGGGSIPLEAQRLGLRAYGSDLNMFVAGFIGSPEMNFAAGRIQGHTLYMGSHVFPLPAGTNIAGYDGKQVVVGLRPSDIREAGGSDTLEMRVEVELIERLGSEILVVFPLDAPAISADALADPDTILGDGRTSFTARLDASAPAARGRGLSLFVEPGAVHLFDPATGLAIGRNDP